jgi:hypothetical protein
MAFKEIYDNIENDFKIRYLFDLLENDPALRSEFLSKMPPVSQRERSGLMPYSEFKDKAGRSYEDYLSLMNKINLQDFDWEDYVPPHGGYVEEWEAYETMAEQEIDDTFGGFKDNLLKSLLQGKLSGIMVEFAAFLRAASDSDIDDPYCIFDDPSDYLINTKMGEWIGFVKNKIPDSKIDDDEIINAIKLFFHYVEENSEEHNVGLFEELFIALIGKVRDKSKLQGLNDIFSVDKKYFPKFATALIKYTDAESWEKVALDLMLEDRSIGKQLLERYLNTGEKAKYIETAKKLFYSNGNIWADEIVGHISPGDDRQFYIDVNIRSCIQNNNVEYYRNIKALLSGAEKEKLMNSVNNNTLKAEILKEDGKYEEIKRLILGLQGEWEFNKKILNTVKHKYPDFTFDMIDARVRDLMEGEKRSRGTYQKIAEWLVYSKGIEGQGNRVNMLVKELYGHKPNLPALKDELRKAGLV